MSEIQQNRYDQLLRRVCDLKGPGSKVSWSLGDLMPVIDVENVPAELLLLEGSRLCMATALLGAGGAGNFSQFILFNDVGSGSIARVIQVDAVSGALANISYGPTQNNAPALGGEAFADTRVFGQGTTLKLKGANNLLVAGGGFYFKQDPGTGGTVEFKPPIALGVVTPGAGFQVSLDTANLPFRASFLWVERQAQPSELNL